MPIRRIARANTQRGHSLPETVELGPLSFYWDSARDMAGWLQTMCHPDGEIAFVDDASQGATPTLAQLTDYASRLGLRSRLTRKAITIGTSEPPGSEPPRSIASRHQFEEPPQGLVWLRDSGYVRVSAGPAVVLVDVAARSRNRGHPLSFELSVGGQRLILNHGASAYGPDGEWLADRGWAAGSTVQIDEADSSRVPGRFWAAPRARPFDIRAEQTENGFRVSTSQDGSYRLPGRPVHQRTWELNAQRLVVIDTIVGEFGEAIARFHLHPGAQPDGEGEHGHLRLPDGQHVRWRVTDGEARIVAERWHPEPGLSVAGWCLKVRFSGNVCRTELEWATRNSRDSGRSTGTDNSGS